MRVWYLLRRRLDRGFSILSVGPNEYRIVFDLALGCGMFLAAEGFAWLFMHSRPVWPEALLPVGLLAANAATGIYSRLKAASIPAKALALAGSLAAVCAAGALLLPNRAVVILWGLLVAAPLVLARVFLGLPHSKHPGVALAVVRQRGPVLVVGGAGYIGSHVVEQLLADGQRVRVLDRLMYGEEPLGEFLSNPRFELLVGDATDIGKLTTAMDGVSGVVHLAGLVGDPACAVDPSFTRHTNIIATRMVKEVAQALGVFRFVFASSCSVYGSSDAEMRETDKLNPVSLYAETKIDSEREILFSVRDGFFATVLRFATVFGHSRRPRFDLVANLFVAQAMARGEITVVGPQQWRPFIHVRDLARAIVLVLKEDPRMIQSQVYNVGDSRMNLTILQLAEAVRKIVGRDREVRLTVRESPEDLRNYRVSFDKIREHFGFEAQTMLTDGVEEMVAHFKGGTYGKYDEASYSNVAMTARALAEFHDPLHSANLYAPLGAAQESP